MKSIQSKAKFGKRPASGLPLFALSTACLLALGSSLSAATWNGTDNNWDTDNWGLAGGGYVGDTGNINANAVINGGAVTVGTAIPNSVGAVTVKNATLNIGANMSSTSGEWRFEGNTTIEQTAGTVNQATFQATTLGYNTQTDNVVWSLSGGSFTNTQRGLDLGRAGNHTNVGTVALNMSGTSSLAFERSIVFNNQNASFNIDASSGATVEVTGNNYGISMASTNTAQQTISYNARIEVTGYNAATKLDLTSKGTGSFMNIHQGAFAEGSLGAAASSVVAFTLSNNVNGVNAWTAATINLGVGAAKGDLEVDVSLLAGANSITLFNYTTLTNGAFGNISINFGATSLALATDPNNLGLNEYFLNYGTGSSDSIVLHYSAIPEPSSVFMILGGLGMAVLLRRRLRKV